MLELEPACLDVPAGQNNTTLWSAVIIHGADSRRQSLFNIPPLPSAQTQQLYQACCFTDLMHRKVSCANNTEEDGVLVITACPRGKRPHCCKTARPPSHAAPALSLEAIISR